MTTKSAFKSKEKKPRIGIKFCPRCGSTDVFWAQGMPQLWSLWQCKNCGYRGPLILENGNMATKLQGDWARKKTKTRTDEAHQHNTQND